MWKEQHDQYDLRYRLLSLLLHLADSPVNNVYEPPVQSDEEREAQVDWHALNLLLLTLESQVDWLALLMEGEEELEPWGEEDTLSDWSDDEEEQEGHPSSSKANVPNEGNQDIGEHMPRKEVSRDHWFKLQVSAAHDWVANQNEGLKPKDSPHSVARLTSEVEGQLEAAGGLGLRTQRTTEYQVL